MLPGFSILSAPGGVSYAAAIAAITNKTIYGRADTSTATDSSSVGSSGWDNEASATDFVGFATFQTNIQNGFRGILSNAASEEINSQIALSTVTGGNIGYTAFAVEKRSGTQGSNTGNNRYINSTVMMDISGYAGMCFEASSRQFSCYSYDTSFHYQALGSFTDNVPYVLAWRVDNSGNLRVNFNGVITTFPAVMVNPGGGSPVQFNQWVAGTNYGFEYIVSSDILADTVMDDAVTALKAKWGIT